MKFHKSELKVIINRVFWKNSKAQTVENTGSGNDMALWSSGYETVGFASIFKMIT